MAGEKYKNFFLEADTDKSGYLTLNELIHTLTKHGYKGGEEKIKSMFKAVDRSGDDKINFEEYMVAMGQVPERDHKEASMRSVFRKFDKDNSGTIDRSELQAVFKEMGRVMDQSEIEVLMKRLDKDQSGSLDYEELIKGAFGK